VTAGEAELKGAQVVHPEGRPAVSPTGRPREQITSDVIQVVSQNFRVEANKRQHNNRSHAEYKLVQQVLRDVPSDEWANLTAVDLHITRMPCALCCATLQEWFQKITGAAVTVSYEESHPPNLGDLVDFPTSEEDLARLRAFPNVTMPAAPAALFATQSEASAASVRAVPVK
jgi:tRNA(Arg) A34 adenosine deaminase TadA